MTEHEVGDKVLIEAEVIGVKPGYALTVELFSPIDQYKAWVRPDLVKEPGTVTLSKSDAECCLVALRKCRETEESVTAVLRITTVIDRLDQQVNPRIPEPGIYGVVEANHPVGLCGERLLWVHGEANGEGNDWHSLTGDWHRVWSDLVDPVEKRPGLEED